MNVQSSWSTVVHLRRYAVPGLVGAAAIATAIAGGVALRQWQHYSHQKTEWQGIQALEQARDFPTCTVRSLALDTTSPFHAAAQTLAQRCRLSYAQQLAGNQKWAEALNVLTLIPKNVEAHRQAQSFQQQWAKQLIAKADAAWQKGEFSQAIAELRTLPNAIAQQSGVEGQANQWQQEVQQNQETLQAAKTLLAQQQWSAAKATLAKVKPHPYWDKQVQPLRDQAEEGIAAVLRYEQELANQRAAEAEAARRQEEAAAYSAPAPSAQSSRSTDNDPAPNAPENRRWVEPSQSAYQVPAEAPVPAAPAPPRMSGFDEKVQTLSEEYTQQGQGSWDAWTQACEASGGRIVDQGPEAVCKTI